MRFSNGVIQRDGSLGGFDFEVVVETPASGVSLTNADTSTSGTYIFSGNSLFGPTLTDLGSTSTDLSATDIALNPGTGTNLIAGESVDVLAVSHLASLHPHRLRLSALILVPLQT